MCRAQSDTVARLRTPAIIMAGEISAPGGPVPPPRILTEENAIDVLNECMEDLGTLFGSNPESRQVGITGAVSFVELDGPCLVVQLSGRFWHQRTRVVERVESYVLDRIPECVSVEIEDVQQLDDADPDEYACMFWPRLLIFSTN